jgi:hypothetical protein
MHGTTFKPVQEITKLQFTLHGAVLQNVKHHGSAFENGKSAPLIAEACLRSKPTKLTMRQEKP